MGTPSERPALIVVSPKLFPRARCPVPTTAVPGPACCVRHRSSQGFVQCCQTEFPLRLSALRGLCLLSSCRVTDSSPGLRMFSVRSH